MEQNREPRNEPTHIQATDLPHGSQEYTVGNRQSLPQMVLGKREIDIAKNELEPLSYTIRNINSETS